MGTGNVFKVAASDLRDHDVFGRLAAAEASDYTPSVILGSRKIEKSQEWPFSYGFLSLERDARAAATIVIAGYSFRDRAVNARLRNLTTPEKRWIVIDRAPTPAAANDFTGAVRDVVGDGQVEFVLDGFGGALPSVTYRDPRAKAAEARLRADELRLARPLRGTSFRPVLRRS